jgi:hypothetical protein
MNKAVCSSVYYWHLPQKTGSSNVKYTACTTEQEHTFLVPVNGLSINFA